MRNCARSLAKHCEHLSSAGKPVDNCLAQDYRQSSTRWPVLTASHSRRKSAWSHLQPCPSTSSVFTKQTARSPVTTVRSAMLFSGACQGPINRSGRRKCLSVRSCEATPSRCSWRRPSRSCRRHLGSLGFGTSWSRTPCRSSSASTRPSRSSTPLRSSARLPRAT